MRISTGLSPGQGATELEVTWPNDDRPFNTMVTCIGEHQNSEPFFLRGRLTPEEVRDWYCDQMRMLAEEISWGMA